MTAFQQAYLHLLSCALVIGAVLALVLTEHITPSTGLGVIAAAGGVNLGAGAVGLGSANGRNGSHRQSDS